MSKIQIKDSLQSRNSVFRNFNQHIGTLDFMRRVPVYYQHMLPGSSFEVNTDVFARLTSMPSPTFAMADIELQAFFVPYRTIFKDWHDFYSQSPTNATNLFASLPTFNVQRFTVMFTSPVLAQQVDDANYRNDADYSFDFYVDQTANHYKFTYLGRVIYNYFSNLGYLPQFNNLSNNNTQFNALNLLCSLRPVLDWYYNQRFLNDNLYVALKAILEDPDEAQKAMLELDYFDGVLPDDWPVLIQAIYFLSYLQYTGDVYYDAYINKDGFTSAGAQPVVSITTAEGSNRASTSIRALNTTAVTNATNSSSSFQYVDGDTPILTNIRPATSNSQASSPAPLISQDGLNVLSAISTYIRRNQISGSRAYESLYAELGIKPDADVFNRSFFVGSSSVSLQVSDVMSTAETSESELGSYAGQGVFAERGSDGTFRFNNDTTDFGLFIIYMSVRPRTSLVIGSDPVNSFTSPLEFYHGDLDGVGNIPVPIRDVYDMSNPRFVGPSAIGNEDSFSSVFGYLPRYYNYKVRHDQLSGNFKLRSHVADFVGSSSWNMFRHLLNDDVVSDISVLDLQDSTLDRSQYDRIFYSSDSMSDHIVFQLLTKSLYRAPIKPLYDYQELDDIDENIGKGSVTVENRGLQVY